MVKRTILVAFALTALMLRPAFADSDGYFCIGKDYLAYQFGHAPPPVASHKLFVVRVNNDGGISGPEEVILPQFQVHGMRCRDTAIDVVSFDSIYTVTFDEIGNIRGPLGSPSACIGSHSRVGAPSEEPCRAEPRGSDTST